MYQLQILLVEDDVRLREIVRKYLVHDNYEVLEAGTGAEAFRLLEEQQFNLVLLDVMLPDTDGWTILRHIKENLHVPVIMMTARSEEDDKLFGFDLGADDYVTKPFSGKELMARVKARLKDQQVSVNKIIKLGGIDVNTSYRQVSIEGEPVEMTSLEYSLLLYFVDNQNIALNRQQILDHVWGYDYFGDERTVDTHVKRLRQKLGIHGDYIKTVRGHGYRMVVEG